MEKKRLASGSVSSIKAKYRKYNKRRRPARAGIRMLVKISNTGIVMVVYHINMRNGRFFFLFYLLGKKFVEFFTFILEYFPVKNESHILSGINNNHSHDPQYRLNFPIIDM